MSAIYFVSQGVDYQLNNKFKVKSWLEFVGKNENVEIERIDYFFVSGNKILEINRKYLGHNYETDIITFNSSFLNNLHGEVFICINVIRDNALIYSKGSFYKELLRVLVHGLLHLVGYNDITNSEIELMRQKENFYLDLLVKFDIKKEDYCE